MSNSATPLGMLHSEENGNVLYRNIANYLQAYTSQNPPPPKKKTFSINTTMRILYIAKFVYFDREKESVTLFKPPKSKSLRKDYL